MIKVEYYPSLSRISQINGREIELLLRSFTVKNSNYDEKAALLVSTGELSYCESENICFIQENDGYYWIPSGLYWALKEWGKNNKVEIEYDGFPSCFETPDEVEDIDPFIIDGVELRDYQIEAIRTAISKKRGILEVATGGGKSEIFIAITKILNRRTLCVVPDQLSMMNMWNRFIKRGVDAGRLGDGHRETDKKVLIAVVNSVYHGVKTGNEEVMEWLSGAEVLCSDECISGDSVLDTNIGPVKIRDIPYSGASNVLSYDGKETVYKEIKNWWKKGIKDTVIISFGDREIKCTPDHLLMTDKGWKEAGLIKVGDFLNCVYAVVEEKQPIIEEVGSQNISLDMMEEILMDQYFFYLMKDDIFWELFLETLVFCTQIKGLKIQELYAIIPQSNMNGVCTNPKFSKELDVNTIHMRTMDLGRNLLVCVVLVLNALLKYMTFLVKTKKRELHLFGLIKLEIVDWHGGFVTTDIIIPKGKYTQFIPKDFQEKNVKLFANGFREIFLEMQGYICRKRNTLLSTWIKKCPKRSEIGFGNLFQNACNTRFLPVSSIRSGGKEEVFDIEVEDTHCFFANGVLVHNCHHQAARTWYTSVSKCNAEYRFALSGTPLKEASLRWNPSSLHETDSLIIGFSGPVIFHLSPKTLISMGVLSQGVFVSFPAFGHVSPKIKFYPSVYDKGIVNNEKRNNIIATLVRNLSVMKRVPLVVVEKLEHGRLIQRILWESYKVPSACSFGSGVICIPKKIAEEQGLEFSDYEVYKSKKNKKTGKAEKTRIKSDKDFVQVENVDVVSWLREGVISTIIGSRIYDEAQDIPFLTDLINASGGKASQRLRQKIGRVLRKSESKTCAWFWDPWDFSHFYLKNHSRERMKIAKEEGYPIIEDWLFSRPLCDFPLPGKIGAISMKEKDVEISVSMTIPLAQGGNPFFIKPAITVSGTLEEGDDLEKCSEILHHKAVSLFVREVYRQAAIAGHIVVAGFEKAQHDVVEQSRKYLEGISS